MSIEGRALSGTVVGALSFVVSALQTFALVPLLLGAWGTERYGAWLAFQALMTLVVTLDGGHHAYVGNELAKLYFGDRRTLSVVLTSAISTAALIGVLEFGIIVGLHLSGTLPKALGLPIASVAAERLGIAALVWMLGWALVGSVAGILARLLPPAGQFVRFTLWGVGLAVVQTTALVCAAALGFRILGATIAFAVITALYTLGLFFDVRRQFRGLLAITRPDVRIGATNFAHSLVLTGSNALAQLQQNGLNLLVAGTLGAAALPAFSTARTVASTFLQAANVLCAPLAPDMVRFHVNREIAKLQITFEVHWLLAGAAIQIGILASLPFLAPLYAVWTRHSFPFQYEVFIPLALAIGVRAFGAPMRTYLASINNLRASAAINAAQTFVVLATAFVGMRWLALEAAALGLLTGEAIGSLVLPTMFVAIELPRQFRRRLFDSAALAIAPTLVTGAALFFYARRHAGPHVLLLGICGILLVLCCQWRRLPTDVHARIWRLLGRATPSNG